MSPTSSEPPPGVADSAGGLLSVPRRGRPLDEAALDEVAAAIATLPEPLAAVAAGVEVARSEGDATGVRKRLFELGLAVVRYAVSLELGLIAERLAEERAPRPLAEALGRAVRLSDGAWCALGRNLAKELEALLDGKVRALAFLSRKPLSDLVEARNQFVHGTGTGDDAPAQVLGLLEDAAPMLGWSLCAVAAVEPPSFEERRGVPLRPGVWRKKRSELPRGVEPDAVYLVHDVGGAPHWTPMAPWLPSSGRKLLLPDAPHAAGASWRSIDLETGEHRESRELDTAIRRLAGQDGTGPVAPTERPTLVGRETVMGVMRRAAELVRAGGVSVVLLTGPQGVGRGRMLEVMREAAPAFGLGVVVEASCLEHRRGVLRPLRRALTDAPTSLGAVREALVRAAAGDALAGTEGLAAAIEAVEEALVEVSLAEPLLLSLDDAQWADEPTLRLLSLLTDRATRRAPGRLLAIVSARDEPRPPAALTALVGQIERDVGAGATRVALTPLDDPTSRRLVRAVAPLAPALEDRLVTGAVGLPFLLVQPVLAWAETGALAWREGRWEPARESVVTEPVPGVAEVVQARLGSSFEAGSDAEQTARHLLAVVGLAGAPLGVADIERVAARLGSDVGATERALEALLETGLLVTSGSRHDVAFAQPIVQQAVVEGLRRRPWFARLYRALLEVLGAADERGEDAAFIASGYLELGDVGAGAAWLRRAIEHALTRGLFRDAVAHADRLASVAPDPRERARAELDAVDAMLRSGDAPAARERLASSMARSLGDGPTAVRARILAVELATALGEEAAGLDPALVRDADGIGDWRLQVEARLALASALRGERGHVLTDGALALLPSESAGDLRYRAYALRGALYHDMAGPTEPACRHSLEQARDEAARLGSRWAMLDAENDLALLLSAAGEHERAVDMLRTVAARAEQQHLGGVRRGALVNIATFLWRANRHEDAARAAATAVEACRRAGDARYLAIALSLSADAQLKLGHGAAARQAIDEAIELKARGGDPNLAIALLRRAEIAAAQGQFDQASADAAKAFDHASRNGQADFVARARLWLALHELRTGGGERALGELGELVRQLGPESQAMRPPTRALFDRVVSELQKRGRG